MSASIKLLCKTCLVVFACHAGAAFADERTDHLKRVGTRFLALFQELDRDRDGRVTRAEAAGDLNFLPAFSDMDINRDDAVTADELRRFIELHVQPAAQ